jgi:pSer/pThr/pTyr-binding forkhead associated (FHA) protein
MPSLVVLGGKSEGTVFDLSQGPELEIGTARKAQIQLRDRGVSYVHARITKRGDSFIIKDEGSRQGTTVNRKRIVEEQELRPGDVIAVGEVELRFDEGSPLPAPRPAPTPGAAPRPASTPSAAPRPVSTPSSAPRPSPHEKPDEPSPELARLEAARDAALAAQRAAEARAARVEAEKAELEQRLDAAAKGLAAAEKDLAAARSDLAEARQTLDEQNVDLIAIQEELESLKEKLGET